MIIYKITNRINGKIYIGQTVRSLNERIAEHIRKKQPVISKAIRKYGIDNFTIERIDHAHGINELNVKEQFWIKFYDCMTPNGYNQCEGGGNTLGYHHSEEAKLKMSIGHKGKKCGSENSFYGKKHSEETKRKLSLKRKGMKHLSPEQLKRFKDSHFHKRVLCVETGQIFYSVEKAALFYGLKATNISRTCREKQRTAGGYHWRYVDE